MVRKSHPHQLKWRISLCFWSNYSFKIFSGLKKYYKMTPKLVYLMSSLQNVPSPQNNFSQKISVAEKILDIFLRNAPSAPNSPQKTNPCWDSLKPAVWFPCICLGRFFTFYHGKSPLNQHVFFSNHHKQIEVSWVCPYRGRHGFACIGLWLVFCGYSAFQRSYSIKFADLSPIHVPKQSHGCYLQI